MSRDMVRVTSKGKVSMTLSPTLHAVVRYLLRMFMSIEQGNSRVLSLENADDRIALVAMAELYSAHYVRFELTPREDMKITISMSQAIIFWKLCQQNDQDAYQTAEMGNLLMQLHQKMIL